MKDKIICNVILKVRDQIQIEFQVRIQVAYQVMDQFDDDVWWQVCDQIQLEISNEN